MVLEGFFPPLSIPHLRTMQQRKAWLCWNSTGLSPRPPTSCRSEEEDLLGGREGLHGGFQCCLVVLQWDLGAGWRSQLSLPDKLAQCVHHGGQVCKGRREKLVTVHHVPEPWTVPRPEAIRGPGDASAPS